jgi:carbon starvation protein CstA
MLVLLIGLIVLILGFVLYSNVVPRIFMPFRETTPATDLADGVDYVAMPTWKNYMIQLLNIAGTGPIFGALMGAKWGPIVFLWIIFGTLLGGAVQDYMAGMMSVRERGLSITSIITKHLGSWTRYIILALVVFLMIMVSATFARSASDLLTAITDVPLWVWMVLILAYFLLSTVLPIDKVIGRLYPVFGILLIVMAVTVVGGLFLEGYPFPGFSIENQHPTGAEYLPDMFITVACGAISGFHATQSPMVSRCIRSEKEGYVVFYGAMVMEAVIALVWAVSGLAFYGDTASLSAALADGGPAGVIYDVATTVAGPIGGIIAVIGVVVCPITSGDTALRAARLMVEDDRNCEHGNKRISLAITSVMMVFIILLCLLDFSVLWSYFSWLNQTLATIVLWTATVFIIKVLKKKWYSLVTALPAVFMTAIVTSFILHSNLGLRLDYNVSVMIGVLLAVCAFVLYLRTTIKVKSTG